MILQKPLILRRIYKEAPAMRPCLKTKETDIARCFQAAVENILDINIIPCDRAVYGSTGLLRHTHMLRAGGNYQTPWTRDAAVNTWNCLRLLIRRWPGTRSSRCAPWMKKAGL